MHATGSRLRDIAVSLLSRPDEIMLEIGAGGELTVARLRAVLAAMLLLLPPLNAIGGGTIQETLIGLGGAIFVNVFAQLWLALARRPRRYRWLPFATAGFDVTATTLVLTALALQHLPAGLNSLIVWCGYVLSIILTALRSDGRVTLFAGGLAIVQYSALVLAVFALASSPEQLISSDYGAVTPGGQGQRVVLLVMVALITAMVVYRMQRLIEMSGTDGLTRLPNRTWLVHRIQRLFDAVRHDGGSLTLALIDLDHFKRINDDNGHHAGDRALRHVVTVLREQTGSTEWLVRLGGEEFVLLLRKPLGTAWEQVDAIRQVLAERPFEPGRGAEPLRLTFSAGLAGYPQEGSDLSRLLRRADRRLQQAKQQGRNRVVARDT
ncbi:GGDEF domain-containing protein [Lysobacter sp. 5GHs7-4]|uniref:GGDEF domain-containing protein n=1 Tax=Lysobacter sp. 5GHs7-4 TaxID=2904253 RepID=UPI001E3E23BA|nr:GGDEF domain-containing protein [Lysobacter sp. 5GHs7-4]UHQ22444.1 GGDEF domain-containing protein [Lysobacter sp. 5GHs7-4]